MRFIVFGYLLQGVKQSHLETIFSILIDQHLFYIRINPDHHVDIEHGLQLDTVVINGTVVPVHTHKGYRPIWQTHPRQILVDVGLMESALFKYRHRLGRRTAEGRDKIGSP